MFLLRVRLRVALDDVHALDDQAVLRRERPSARGRACRGPCR